VLNRRWFGICTGVLLLVCACGAADAPKPPRQDPSIDGRDVVLATEEREVCVASGVDPAPCVPIVSSREPVLSATLARLDTAADVVMVLSRSDVVVAGLGPGTLRVPVRPGGRRLLLWLRTLPAGTPVVCASYRATDAEGRMVVHRSLTVATAGVAALGAEPDHAC
jgi:hypothetical protein